MTIKTEIFKTQIENIFEKSFPAWGDLTQLQREKMIDATTTRSFKKGMHVHTGKDDCLGVLLVVNGSLRAYLLSESGREITLFHIQEGEYCVLPAECILPLITFDIFVDALEDVNLLVVSPKAFSALMEENPLLDAFAYKQTAERFSEVMWIFNQVLFVSFDKRLAVYLVEEYNLKGSNRIDMTHEVIARDLGSAREVVTRMLKYFQQEGLVKLSRGTITLLNLEGLSEIARC